MNGFYHFMQFAPCKSIERGQICSHLSIPNEINEQLMNVLVVEKEKKEALKLVRILRLVDPSITVVETVDSLATLLKWIQQNPSPDLVLINQAKLPDLTVENTAVLARLVLHTKQYSFTYLAFRANALNQLQHSGLPLLPTSKGIPVKQSSAREDDINDAPAVTQLFKNRFFVESGQRFLSIPVNDIAYFFSDGRFVFFTTHSKNKYIIHYRMEELQVMLNPEEFYRINRSFIVSIKSIDQIHPYFGGRFKLKLLPTAEEEVLVSRKRVPGFRKWLGE